MNDYAVTHSLLPQIIVTGFIILLLLWLLANPEKVIIPNKRKKPRFVMHPGCVKSVIDGEIHNISYGKLVEYYRLDPRTDDIVDYLTTARGYRKQENDIWLFPRENGDYIEYLESWLKSKNLER